MENLIIKEYKDFEKIINKLKKDKEIKIDLKDVSYRLKTRIIDLITGYIYESGTIKKESVDKYIVCLTK